jgi:hypothetical protein
MQAMDKNGGGSLRKLKARGKLYVRAEADTLAYTTLPAIASLVVGTTTRKVGTTQNYTRGVLAVFGFPESKTHISGNGKLLSTVAS